ncbi:Thioredoxin-like protein 4B [Hordeum vulgare]|nr:Thioredoxin-like protein 4B [Hordeum vulgare]
MQLRRESLRQGAALDEMMQRLEQRLVRADGLTVARRRVVEGVDRQKEWGNPLIPSFLAGCSSPARGERGEMGSVVLTTLWRKREVDAAIRDTLDKVLVLRFGRASDAAYLRLDDVLAKSSWDISKFATVALVDMDSEEIQVYVDYFDITLSPRFCLKQHYM